MLCWLRTRQTIPRRARLAAREGPQAVLGDLGDERLRLRDARVERGVVGGVLLDQGRDALAAPGEGDREEDEGSDAERA